MPEAIEGRVNTGMHGHALANSPTIVPYTAPTDPGVAVRVPEAATVPNETNVSWLDRLGSTVGGYVNSAAELLAIRELQRINPPSQTDQGNPYNSPGNVANAATFFERNSGTLIVVGGIALAAFALYASRK